jgi:hypothetical protein
LTDWDEELKKKKVEIEIAKSEERVFKKQLELLEKDLAKRKAYLRNDIRQLETLIATAKTKANRSAIKRRELEKNLEKYKRTRKAALYRHQNWAKDNIGPALATLEQMK